MVVLFIEGVFDPPPAPRDLAKDFRELQVAYIQHAADSRSIGRLDMARESLRHAGKMHVEALHHGWRLP